MRQEALVAALALTAHAVGAQTPSTTGTNGGGGSRSEARPTILLIHGGFVDGSGWEGVYKALTRDGYSQTDDVAHADLVILNTCHIREKAAEKVYSDLGRIRDIKEARKRGGKHGDTRIVERFVKQILDLLLQETGQRHVVGIEAHAVDEAAVHKQGMTGARGRP